MQETGEVRGNQENRGHFNKRPGDENHPRPRPLHQEKPVSRREEIGAGPVPDLILDIPVEAKTVPNKEGEDSVIVYLRVDDSVSLQLIR